MEIEAVEMGEEDERKGEGQKVEGGSAPALNKEKNTRGGERKKGEGDKEKEIEREEEEVDREIERKRERKKHGGWIVG